MNYREKEGVWQHPSRKAIFVGDYIDKGPSIRETLHLVRNMQQKGHAIALMGNHEYNALAYDYVLSDGTHLRQHNAVHNKQHEQTLLQFKGHEEEWTSFLQWFYTLPLYLELEELRAVHACWDEEAIPWLREKGYGSMNEELLVSSHNKGSYPNRVINDILKGKEYNIPEENAWKDKDGHTCLSNRLRWWKDPKASSYGEFLFNCPLPLQGEMIQEEVEAVVYPHEAKPVFYGHYWLEDPYPVVQASNIICLDYSIAKGGNMVAYRWQGEGRVKSHHFVSVNYQNFIFISVCNYILSLST